MKVNEIMKEKKIFSSKLYLEGLRQLKGIGLILLALNILRAVMVYVSFKQPGIESVYRYTRLGNVLMIFGAIVMTCKLFGFMNSRSKSDFYHLIPYTRICLLFSFFAAIFTWSCVILLPPAICEIQIVGKLMFWINGYNVLNQLVLTLYVICGMMLACCITGTTLSSVIVGIMIVFGPRFFMDAVLYIWRYTRYMSSIIPVSYISPVLSGKYSFISDLTHSIDFRSMVFPYPVNNGFVWIDNSLNKDYILRIVYSLVVVLIYLILAIIAFRKRNSEMAEKIAKNKYIQAGYRIIFTMLISMYAVYKIVMCINNIGYVDKDVITEIVGIYIVVIFAYYLFEIVTTGTVKNLLRITKGLVIVAILNIAMIAGISVSHMYVYNNIPKPEEVKSFSLMYNIGNNSGWMQKSGAIYNLYEDYLRETTPIYDKECVERIINVLKVYRDNNYPIVGSNAKKIIVKINNKNGDSIYRYIYINTDLYLQIVSAYENNDEYVNKKKKDIYRINQLGFHEYPIYGDELWTVGMGSNKEVVDTFLEEYDSLSDEDKNNVWFTDVDFYDGNKKYRQAYAVVKMDGIEMEIPLYIDEKFEKTREIYNKEYMKFLFKEGIKNSPYDKKDAQDYIDRMYDMEEYYNGLYNLVLSNVFWYDYFEMADLSREEVEVIKDNIISAQDNVDEMDVDILTISFGGDNGYFIAETEEVKELINNHISEDEGE